MMREKYRDFLTNETAGIQGVINRFGLRFPERDIQLRNGSYFINGYTIPQWNALTNEQPSSVYLNHVSKFMNESEKRGDISAVDILKTRYGAALEERERNKAYRILLAHNIPPDTEYSKLDYFHIEGITFNCWRLLHDDEYDPSKAILVSNHQFLKQSCRVDDVAYIEDKYHEALFPNRKEIISEAEIAEANSYFAHIHELPF